MFVIGEKNGVCGKAVQVPGIRALNLGGVPSGESSPAGPAISQVPCPSAGNCAVTGIYQNQSGFPHPFVASEHRQAVAVTFVRVHHFRTSHRRPRPSL